MRLSQYFFPTLKENPAEAQIASHRYMLRAGMIRQSAAGIYSWLPLGLRVLKKIEQIVREEQNATGAHELLMPTIQSADLWKESGRYDDYGKEMLRITDRHDRDMLYGPTNEELITDIVRQSIHSYKSLPQMLYHIQWKFRDEVRPRFGVMRGREFLMKDAYSFDLTADDARKSYYKMFAAYLRSFAKMGLRAIPMKADTGPIGGDLSHEFIILAETGESEVFCDPEWLKKDVMAEQINYQADLSDFVADWTKLYAATDEIHDPETSPLSEDQLLKTRGIEVGHIFYFGTKYSKPLGAVVPTAEGETVPLEMGSYGIGVSRLLGAIIEANHDENGIIWPEAVSPFDVGLINLKVGHEGTDHVCKTIYDRLQAAGKDVLLDDRSDRAGAKFADMDLIGLPWQIVVGPKSVAQNAVEVKNRRTGERTEMALEAALEKFTQ